MKFTPQRDSKSAKPSASAQDWEAELERLIGRVLGHRWFLRGVGTALNLNSYRKIALDRALRSTWRRLQLPTGRDQERALHLINELHHRIDDLEASLARLRPARSSFEEASAEVITLGGGASELPLTRKKKENVAFQ